MWDDEKDPGISRPQPAHLRHSNDGYQDIPDLEPGPPPPNFGHRHRRHPIIAILNFVAVILGLASLSAFIKRRFSSTGQKGGRDADWADGKNKRAYKRAARRAAWKNWPSSGHVQVGGVERRMEFEEEKRALVRHGESEIEDTMQNEISQLRRAHSVVDELLRAEEGRGTLARPVLLGHRVSGMAGITGVMMGRPHTPAPIYTGSTINSSNASAIITPPTLALSRTDSLPMYQTDPESDYNSDARSTFSDNPPPYKTDDDDSSDSDSESRPAQVAIVANSFRRYQPSEYAGSLFSPLSDGVSIFSPGSSIPDLSPRTSVEVGRS